MLTRKIECPYNIKIYSELSPSSNNNNSSMEMEDDKIKMKVFGIIGLTHF